MRGSVTDGYGQTLDRHGACQGDASKTVTVMVTGAWLLCVLL